MNQVKPVNPKKQPQVEPDEPSSTNLKKPNSIEPSTLYTCRICLEEGPALHAHNESQLQHLQTLLKQEPTSYLISTCICNGTSGYVHEPCMAQWIDSQIKRTKQKHIKCQICLGEIVYDRKTSHYFEFACEYLQKVTTCNIVCLVTLVVVQVLFAILVINSENFNLTELTKWTIIILMMVIGLGLILSLALIIREAFYKSKRKTTKVYSTDECQVLGIEVNHLSHYDVRSRTTHVRGSRGQSTERSHSRSRQSRSQRRSQSGMERQGSQRQVRSVRHIPSHERNDRGGSDRRRINREEDRQSARSIRSAPRRERHENATRTLTIRSRGDINDINDG